VSLFAVVVVTIVALASALAQAGLVDSWQSVGSFDGSGVPAGSFGGPERLAVDQSGDLLYVLDQANGVLLKYDVSGADPVPADFSALGSPAVDGAGSGEADETPQGGLGLTIDADVAVDNSGGANDGNVYVASENGNLYAFAASGAFLYALDGSDGGGGLVPTPTGSLDNPCGVAVDDQGDVYVAGYFASAVRKFTPSGGSADFVSETSVGSPACHIAVDSQENLYAGHYFADVEKFDSTGASQGVVDPGPAMSVAVDPSNDRVYVNRGSEIAEHAPNGDLLATFGSNVLGAGSGVAVQGAGNLVYASDGSDQRVEIFDYLTITTPDVTTEPADPIGPHTATLRGTVDPLGVPASYRFEYRRQASSGDWTQTPSEDAGSEAGIQQVSADIDQLPPNTAYEYRLIATNTDANQSTTSNTETFTTGKVAPIAHLNSSAAGKTKLIISGYINPRNTPADYHFEYGTKDCATNPCTSIPTTDHTTTAINDSYFVTQTITGLQPDTTYHYRLVATNPAGTDTTETRTAVTSTGLPDNRRYEMVSPPDKNGADVLTYASRARAAKDGNAVQFASLGAFSDTPGTSITTEYISQRGSNGWTTHGISPAHDPDGIKDLGFAPDIRYMGDLSDDLSQGVLVSQSPLTSDPNTALVRNFYLRSNLLEPGQGNYTLVTGAAAPVTPPVNNYQPIYAGASEDFSHVLFGSILNLTGETTGNQLKLYESIGGNVRLASILPDSEGGGPAFRALPGRAFDFSHYVPTTISRDGRRIFFTSTPGSNGVQGDLYVREDGETTTQINLSEKSGAPSSPQPAQLEYVTPDGSYVFFLSSEQLTDAPVDGNNEIYRYAVEEPEGQRLTLISSVNGEGLVDGASVEHVLGVSDDGSNVYFLSASNIPEDGPPLVPTFKAVYAWHDGEVSLVGAQNDVSNFPEFSWVFTRKESRVTPDGKHLLFVSTQDHALTGVDPGPCEIEQGTGCLQVYVYSAEANGGQGELACASCHVDGAPPSVDASVMPRKATGSAHATTYLNRALTSDGSRVFFSTAEGLVPDDRDGRSDAYMYDVASGQLWLLSVGTATDSYFLDASADGDDVFFTTRDQLVDSDTDDVFDLYDARVGGGFPESGPPAKGCSGVACRDGAPSGGGGSDGPASKAFSGPGNPAAGGAVFSMARIGAIARRKLARTGRLALAVRVRRAGRLRVTATSPIAGAVKRVAAATRDTNGPGRLNVQLRLSQAARRQLRDSGRLRLRLRVDFTGARPAITKFTLKARKSANGNQGS
jgi:hypothetical protein